MRHPVKSPLLKPPLTRISPKPERQDKFVEIATLLAPSSGDGWYGAGALSSSINPIEPVPEENPGALAVKEIVRRPFTSASSKTVRSKAAAVLPAGTTTEAGA